MPIQSTCTGITGTQPSGRIGSRTCAKYRHGGAARGRAQADLHHRVGCDRNHGTSPVSPFSSPATGRTARRSRARQHLWHFNNCGSTSSPRSSGSRARSSGTRNGGALMPAIRPTTYRPRRRGLAALPRIPRDAAATADDRARVADPGSRSVARRRLGDRVTRSAGEGARSVCRTQRRAHADRTGYQRGVS